MFCFVVIRFHRRYCNHRDGSLRLRIRRSVQRQDRQVGAVGRKVQVLPARERRKRRRKEADATRDSRYDCSWIPARFEYADEPRRHRRHLQETTGAATGALRRQNNTAGRTSRIWPTRTERLRVGRRLRGVTAHSVGAVWFRSGPRRSAPRSAATPSQERGHPKTFYGARRYFVRRRSQARV